MTLRGHYRKIYWYHLKFSAALGALRHIELDVTKLNLAWLAIVTLYL